MNIPGMPLKDIKNISHPELKILNNLVNWRHTDTLTHAQMHLTKSWAVPATVGQLKTGQDQTSQTSIRSKWI